MTEIESQLLKPLGSEEEETEVAVTTIDQTLAEIITESLNNETNLWHVSGEYARHENGTELFHLSNGHVALSSEPYVTFSPEEQYGMFSVIKKIKDDVRIAKSKESTKKAMARFNR